MRSSTIRNDQFFGLEKRHFSRIRRTENSSLSISKLLMVFDKFFQVMQSLNYSPITKKPAARRTFPIFSRTNPFFRAFFRPFMLRDSFFSKIRILSFFCSDKPIGFSVMSCVTFGGFDLFATIYWCQINANHKS